MRSRQYKSRIGFTLTEMLVVVSIVVLLTALSIPSLIQMGVFSSNKTGNAAREYYEMLRAARTYATTHNVETALVYQTRLVYEMANDEFDATDMVPIIDAYAVCRRLSSEEIRTINDDFQDDGNPNRVVPEDALVYIPVPESNGRFRSLPDGTCILPEIFEVDGTGVTNRALSAVYVVDPALVLPSVDDALGERDHESGYLRAFIHPFDQNLTNGMDDDLDGTMNELDEADRLHFEQADPDEPLEVDLANPPGAISKIHAFPAHRFAPSGEILPLQTVQRFQARVGMVPTTTVDQRFVTYEDAVVYDPVVDPSDAEPLTIQFHSAELADAPAATETVYRFHDPRREPEIGDNKFDLDALIENSVRLNIYTATGRVEILPTLELEDLDDT